MVGIVKRPSCLVLAGSGVAILCLALADAAVKPLGDAELASVTGAQTVCLPCCYHDGRNCFSSPMPPITDPNCEAVDILLCKNEGAVCKWENVVIHKEDICLNKDYRQGANCTQGAVDPTETCFSVRVFHCYQSALDGCVCAGGTNVARGATTTCATPIWFCPVQ